MNTFPPLAPGIHSNGRLAKFVLSLKPNEPQLLALGVKGKDRIAAYDSARAFGFRLGTSVRALPDRPAPPAGKCWVWRIS